MRVSFHAGERFLQRVFQLGTYSKRHVLDAIRLIERDIRGIQLRNVRRFPLPSFPDYYGVVADDTLVTVIPKKSSRT